MELRDDLLRSLVTTCIGRRTDYALQRENGRYYRVGRPLTYGLLRGHLQGVQTLATYVIDEQGTCRFAVFDSDLPDGLERLLAIQSRLAAESIPSYLEASRRGGHLWVFFSRLLAPDLVRSWLLPYYPGPYISGEMEFYPKQTAGAGRLGSLIRVPLGVHRLTGRRYPFIALVNGTLVPLVGSVSSALVWLSTVERASVPDTLTQAGADHAPTTTTKNTLQKKPHTTAPSSSMTVRDWCLEQDAVQVIGRYVELDQQGLGCCPFGWHHSDGQDSHPSLWVHTPVGADVACWYCHVWQRGGSVFDFLRCYYSLDARTLWRRICSGEQF